MNKNLIFAFFLFVLVEYFLRTFVSVYKYHQTGFLLENLPLAIATLFVCIISKKNIATIDFGSVYLQLSLVSVLGFIVAKALLYFQWYWILHPEYKNNPTDMKLGFTWNVVFSLVGMVHIFVFYFIILLFLKKFIIQTTQNK